MKFKIVSFFLFFGLPLFGQTDQYDSLAKHIKEMMELHYQFTEGNVRLNNDTVQSYQWVNISTDSFSVEVLENFDKIYITVFHLTEFNTLYPSSHIKIYRQEPIKRPTPKEKIFGVLIECFYQEQKNIFFRLLKNAKIE